MYVALLQLLERQTEHKLGASVLLGDRFFPIEISKSQLSHHSQLLGN